jgi:hypothetical protein
MLTTKLGNLGESRSSTTLWDAHSGGVDGARMHLEFLPCLNAYLSGNLSIFSRNLFHHLLLMAYLLSS